MRILVTRRWPQAVEEQLQALGEVTLNHADEPMTAEALSRSLEEYDVVCPTVTDRLDASVFAACTDIRTRLLANFGVGVNHIDLDAASTVGMVVTNTPGVLTDATAEIALTLLLTCARRTSEGERQLRDGNWTGWRPTHMLSTQVTGKVLGIVGMGRIGISLARKACHGLGMQILYYSRSALDESIARELGARRLSLDELLVQSDFVSLHCPATPDTRHLLNRDTLALMGSHSFLINTARGDVVDEAALVDALRDGQIAGAGLDVYEAEPALAPGLAVLDNAVLLPHMGSGTVETRLAMGQCALDNVAAYLQGKRLPNLVERV